MIELARSIYRRFWVLPRVHRNYRDLSTREAFQKVYASGAWGGGSGSGSSGPAARQYVDDVCEFIAARKITSVIDLGCGDFQVGRRIVERTGVAYTGVDIVPSLIESHVRNFPALSFVCANLAADPLPIAELCLVRQVLQHLSNAEISAVLHNIEQYPLALISEHVPVKPRSFNRDKPHGPDVRAYYASGVYVDKPPFSRKISTSWDRDLEPGSLLRTVVIESG